MTHTVIIRHPKERRSKCSLTPLEGMPGLQFLVWSKTLSFQAEGHTLLCVDAPPLSPADSDRPLLLLDATWRRLKQMQGCIRGEPIRRSIPANVATAYPRVSRYGDDPAGGLASVEALFVARAMLGHWEPELLADYHWRELFLSRLPAGLLQGR